MTENEAVPQFARSRNLYSKHELEREDNSLLSFLCLCLYLRTIITITTTQQTIQTEASTLKTAGITTSLGSAGACRVTVSSVSLLYGVVTIVVVSGVKSAIILKLCKSTFEYSHV